MQKIGKVIMVGDQNQLPATVFSDNAEQTKFNRSLYERFLDNNIPRFVLTIQYRMHPMIREFPSNQFYSGEITDADKVLDRDRENDPSKMKNALATMMFYDLEYAQEDKSSQDSKSKSNEEEATFIARMLILAIKSKSETGNLIEALNSRKYDIGIITPYKKQSNVIKDKIEYALKSEIGNKMGEINKILLKSEEAPLSLNINKIVEVNTVDSFQGREKDIIIIS